MEVLCGLFGKTRQGYYDKRQNVCSEVQRCKVILDLVAYYRSRDPRLGGVKLYHLVVAIVGKEVARGRGSFLKLLSDNRLMLPRNKPRYTTDSRHTLRKYPNLVKGIVAEYPNQIWYADITYVWIRGDVLYLHLITDGYSHAVLGWCLSETLEAANTVMALKMAIAIAGDGNLCGTTHHSDRGVQYASQAYVSLLMEHHIRVSMTETYKPTDNAIAERMNGILKTEWIYHSVQYESYEQAYREVEDMIGFYNNERPHMSIGMKIPMDVYNGEVPGRNLWKKSAKDDDMSKK